MRITLHFYDIAFLTFQLGCNLVQSFFCLGIQSRLRGAEMQLGVGNLLVLINVRDRSIQLAGLSICLLRQRLCLPSLSACLLSLLVCSLRRALRLVNPGLSPSVDILNIVRVLCSELIKLVQPIFYWRYLTIDPLLTGQGVHLPPEAFSGLSGKRLSS